MSARTYALTALVALVSTLAIVLLGTWSLVITCPLFAWLGWNVWGPEWSRQRNAA